MAGTVIQIESKTEQNDNFRQVLITTTQQQLVLMCLQPGEDIGQETHDSVDQFFRIESGTGTVFLDGMTQKVGAGDSITVPMGVKHNLTNDSASTKLKLYTIYTPPQHRDGTTHQTKADALKDEADHA
jgi:mannose-6-phosphate isomerase-like protein (cupin superfamily)